MDPPSPKRKRITKKRTKSTKRRKVTVTPFGEKMKKLLIKQQRTTKITTLPTLSLVDLASIPEITVDIFKLLRVKDALQLCQTNTAFSNYCDDETLWKYWFKRDYGYLVDLTTLDLPMYTALDVPTYRAAYKHLQSTLPKQRQIELFNSYVIFYNKTLTDYAEYNDNGQLHGEKWKWTNIGVPYMIYNYENGILHGEQTTWYDNGALESRMFFKNNLLHGKSEFFYDNGHKLKEAFFKNDKLHGELITYFDNGHIETIKNYKNGKLHGISKEFYYNEQLKVQANYKDDKLHGERKEWLSTGKPHSKEKFWEGKCSKSRLYLY